MKRRIGILVAALAVLAVPPTFAADATAPSQYTLGDQTLAIDAGLFVPLFLLPGPSPLLDITGTSGLSLGAVGGLSWAAYVAPTVRVGIEVAGNFTLSPNSNSLLMLPFIAKASYVFTAYPFEIPVTLGVGANIIKYVNMTWVDLLVRPGVSGLWIYNSSWSFGFNLNWWMDLQFAANPADSRVGNFLEISLVALYHF